jgi:ribonuclease HI
VLGDETIDPTIQRLGFNREEGVGEEEEGLGGDDTASPESSQELILRLSPDSDDPLDPNDEDPNGGEGAADTVEAGGARVAPGTFVRAPPTLPVPRIVTAIAAANANPNMVFATATRIVDMAADVGAAPAGPQVPPGVVLPLDPGTIVQPVVGVVDAVGPCLEQVGPMAVVPPHPGSPPAPRELLHRRLTCDGGASPNPGSGNPGDVSGCGMVCLAPHANGGFQSPDNAISEWDGLAEWTDYYRCGRSSTNNTYEHTTEWWGVLAAVRRAIREGKFGLTVLMDSQLVVRQFDQSCTVSDHWKPFCR